MNPGPQPPQLGFRPGPPPQQNMRAPLPPYRAPPPGMQLGPPGPPGPKPGGPSQPYSRFNISEPNMAVYKSSPVGYRHTINHENSSQVQSNLKAMLGQGKHQTLDMGGQSAAIHHLRMQGLERRGEGREGPGYEAADTLRNQANKMFARNGTERSSGLAPPSPPPPVSYPAHYPASPHNQ